MRIASHGHDIQGRFVIAAVFAFETKNSALQWAVRTGAQRLWAGDASPDFIRKGDFCVDESREFHLQIAKVCLDDEQRAS
ncbi:hypothetical protein D3C80_1915880 [compost metagenome]